MRIRDWSSDVCSSDLNILVHIIGKGELQGGNSNLGHPLLRSSRSKSRDGNMCIFAYIRRARCNCSGTRHLLADAVKTATAGPYGIAHQSDNRSEERRVGKKYVSTCRYRGSPYQ